MTTLERPARQLEWVTATTVRALHADGKLPVPSGPPKPGQRLPTIEEWLALRWILAWERDTVVGVGAFRPIYDYHSGRDVHEIVLVRGSRRAVVDLTRRMIENARSHGRPCIGAVDFRNLGMRNFLATEAYPVREVFEAFP